MKISLAIFPTRTSIEKVHRGEKLYFTRPFQTRARYSKPNQSTKNSYKTMIFTVVFIMLVRVEIYINVRYVIFTYVFAYRNWRSSRNFRPKLPTVLFLLVDPSFRFNPTRASVTNRKFRARHSIGISGCPRGTCLPCSATVSIKITTSELDSR